MEEKEAAASKRLVATQKCKWCKQPMPADYNACGGPLDSESNALPMGREKTPFYA